MTPAKSTQSDAFEVTSEMLRERLGCGRTAFWQYQRRGLIQRGKRRQGSHKLFFTVAQANRLLTRLGSKAPRFEEQD